MSDDTKGKAGPLDAEFQAFAKPQTRPLDGEGVPLNSHGASASLRLAQMQDDHLLFRHFPDRVLRAFLAHSTVLQATVRH